MSLTPLDVDRVATGTLDATGSIEVTVPPLAPRHRGLMHGNVYAGEQLRGTISVWFEGRDAPFWPFHIQLGPTCAGCRIVLFLGRWGEE